MWPDFHCAELNEKHPRAFFLYRNKNWDTQGLNMQGGAGSLSDGARGEMGSRTKIPTHPAREDLNLH